MIDQAQNLRELMFKKKKRGARFVTITGGGKDVGKTCIARNLAVELKRSGKRPLIIGIGEQHRSTGSSSGIVQNTMAYVVRNKKNLRDIITVGSGDVMCMAGGNFYELADLDSQLMRNEFMRLDDVADVILFDAQMDEAGDFVRLICASHETIIVINPDSQSLIDGYTIIKRVSQRNANAKIHLVLNKAEGNKKAQMILTNFIETVNNHINVTVHGMGCIPADECVIQGDKMKESVLISDPECLAAQSIKQFAQKYIAILDKGTKLKGYSEFLSEFLDERTQEIK